MVSGDGDLVMVFNGEIYIFAEIRVAVSARTTLNELFEIIRSLLEPRYPHLRDLRPIYREFRPGDVRFSQADIGKSKRLLGYLPVWGVSQGLARSIDWYVAKLSPRRSIKRGASRPQAALP